jgi:hypothetical protein
MVESGHEGHIGQHQEAKGFMIYTAWNIGKERNHRIFWGHSATPGRVLQLIKDEFATRAAACEFLSPLLYLMLFLLFRLCKVEFLTLLCNDNHVTNRMLSSLK